MEQKFIRFIGDVHGYYDRYKTVLKNSPYPTVQVGDMGVGFRICGGPLDGQYGQNPPHDLMVKGNHRFIRGNHDNPEVCRRQSQWIEDGTVDEDSIMYVGGAFSIDAAYRKVGYSWWLDEELSEDELASVTIQYLSHRPRIMVTHTAPAGICAIQIAEMSMPGYHSHPKFPHSRTENTFQRMFELHQPKVWIFGHWHRSFDQVHNGTRFICLDELQTKDIDIYAYK